MPDRLLGDRYHLQNLLGTGGMATVYQAEDLYLHRRVAVKILRLEFAQSEDLVKSFRREAQAAARLSHPNIVSIYDVGETRDGQHYLVMEMVEGRTLKDVIRQRGALGEREALGIARQIAQALQHAHARGVIHRDIKPHNILVSDRGEIKVTDFGIARAVTDATLVNTRSIVGSAHYFSPEQARGGVVDAKSDLYSLGVVLYEMLTGSVPYDGESPITVALQHLQGDLVSPRRLRPELSEGTERICLGLLAKDPAQRYPSADAVIADLDRALVGAAPMRRLPPPKRRRWPYAVLFLLLLLGAAVFAFEHWMAVPVVRVPDVRRESLAQAEANLRRRGLVGVRDALASSTVVGKGLVLSQDPGPGSRIRKGRRVRLTVSAGPPLVTVPDFTYDPLEDAKGILQGMGLRWRIRRRYREAVPEGYVFDQSPPGNTPEPLGAVVTLMVSAGAPVRSTRVPNLIGEDLKQATADLTAAGLEISDIHYEPDSRPAGTVIGQKPAAGMTVAAGSSVSLTLSPGNGGNLTAAPLPQEQTLIIDIPSDLAPGTEVKVVVGDQNGSHVFYDKPGEPGSQISVPVRWVGKGQVTVYLGSLAATQEALPVASNGSQSSSGGGA